MSRRIVWEEVTEWTEGNGVVFYSPTGQHEGRFGFIEWGCWTDTDPHAELHIAWRASWKPLASAKAERTAIEDWIRKPDRFFEDIGAGVFVGINA